MCHAGCRSWLLFVTNQKLENPMETIKPLLPHADSIMLTRGILRTSVSPEEH